MTVHNNNVSYFFKYLILWLGQGGLTGLCVLQVLCASVVGLVCPRGCACPRVQYVLESCAVGATNTLWQHLVSCGTSFSTKKTTKGNFEGQLCLASPPSRAIQAFLPAEVKMPREAEGRRGNGLERRYPEHGVTVVRKANP